MAELLTSFVQAIINKLDVILGGIIGIAGSFIIFRYQIKKTRQIRFDQLLAEKQIDAMHKANSKLNYIEGMTLQSRPEKTSKKMIGYNGWFLANRSYLPDEFSKKWCLIRDTLRKVIRLKNSTPRDNYKISELENSVRSTIDEARNILGKKFKR